MYPRFQARPITRTHPQPARVALRRLLTRISPNNKNTTHIASRTDSVFGCGRKILFELCGHGYSYSHKTGKDIAYSLSECRIPMPRRLLSPDVVNDSAEALGCPDVDPETCIVGMLGQPCFGGGNDKGQLSRIGRDFKQGKHEACYETSEAFSDQAL